MSRSAAERRQRAEPPVEDRRMPASAQGWAARWRRWKGLLARPLRVQRRGLQLHLVLVDRRRNRPAHQEPTVADVRSELRERLLAMEHQHAARGMGLLLRVHDELRRRGWSGVEAMTARDLGRALAQSELLSGVEPSPVLTHLTDRLRIFKTAAGLREERKASFAAAEQGQRVDVSETDFAAYEESERDWVDTAAPADAPQSVPGAT
jgi:hypothetical protein